MHAESRALLVWPHQTVKCTPQRNVMTCHEIAWQSEVEPLLVQKEKFEQEAIQISLF